MSVARNEAGVSWSELAQLDPLAAVLDPADSRGAKNRTIDRAHKHALRNACGDLAGARALDFGCGTGRLSSWLASHGASVDGVDATEEMIAIAQGAVPGARFQTIDGGALPFPDSTFDLVLTAYVLQYYVRASPAIPLEIARVLKPAGLVVAIEQVTDDPISLGRGGSIAAYAQLFSQTGLTVIRTRAVRAGNSRLIGLVQRLPLLRSLPGLPPLLGLEARLALNAPLEGDSYVDALFVARR
jgi:SAM-dependent methyltransferase